MKFRSGIQGNDDLADLRGCSRWSIVAFCGPISAKTRYFLGQPPPRKSHTCDLLDSIRPWNPSCISTYILEFLMPTITQWCCLLQPNLCSTDCECSASEAAKPVTSGETGWTSNSKKKKEARVISYKTRRSVQFACVSQFSTIFIASPRNELLLCN